MIENNKEGVIVRLLHDKDDGNNLHVYVVSAEGKIIETAPFTKGEAKLNSSRTALSGETKVYIASTMPKELAAKANERMLMKAGAYQAVKKFTGNLIDVYKIPGGILNRWFWNNCLITGHVNKDFNIDGKISNHPICNARVHICEVETELRWPYIPIYRRKIPDWVINEIGQKFKNIKPIINPHPIPDPIGPVSQQKMKIEMRSLGRNNTIAERTKLPTALPLHQDVLSSMTSGSVATIRKAMYDYHDILYPYFCLWPIYWPWIYTYDEETIVYTDCNGHFEMWENTLTEDGPLNIYIWVEVCINGQWVTVYKPPLPCYTNWNYSCNTDINIQVTDSRVAPCDCTMEGPADAVWFRSIGLSASALHIEQNTFSTIPLQGSTLKNGGCTDIIDGQKISPFGGGLALKLFCGANIFAAGVTHYRWRKTMVADANQNVVAGISSLILGNVTRPYLVKLSATHYETHYVSLGAEGTGADFAYRIPHHNVTAEPVLQDPADANPARMAEWTDMFFDSAYLDSNSLTDGIYKFELELLKKEVSGSFTVVPVAKATFQISEYNTIGNSQDAPNTYLNINSGNSAKADSYKMKVRIDNASCVADIHDARINETGALSGPCGFIKYTDTAQHVHISFEASHPRNFATFSFGIVKGNGSQPTGIGASGYVLSAVTGFPLSGGLFNADFTVLSMLNGCIGQAAFSENLSVWSLATDGSTRLYGQIENGGTDNPLNAAIYYNPSDVNAFALSNT
jgi:hypothetical protein